MRPFILVLAVLLVSSIAHAEPCSVARAAADSSGCTEIVPRLDLDLKSRFETAKQLTEEEHHGVVVRNTGIALTALGIAATIAGATLFTTNLCIDSCDDSASSDLGLNAGIGLLVVGQTSALAGIGMWAGGGKEAVHARRALLSIGATGAMVKF